MTATEEDMKKVKELIEKATDEDLHRMVKMVEEEIERKSDLSEN